MNGKRLVIGVDIGGTNTDAVLLDGKEIISKAKCPTTSDTISGSIAAIQMLFESSDKSASSVAYIAIGTTHFINAILEGKYLSKVSVIRLCGPCGKSLEPFSLFPSNLRYKMEGPILLANGGFNYDGKDVITDINKKEIKKFVKMVTKDYKINQFVICGTFSPVNNIQELQIEKEIKVLYPNVSITLSSTIGNIGFMERENGSILNESLKPLARSLLINIETSFKQMGFICPVFMTLNDGTLASLKECESYPIRTFSSGMTNTLRGASFLTNLTNAIVIDIGGTSTDCGLMINKFAKFTSTRTSFGGIITNFQIPDVISIGLGGGSIVKNDDKNSFTIGPESVGKDLLTKSRSFGGKFLTLTDVAIKRRYLNINDATFVDINQNELTKIEENVMTKLEDITSKMIIGPDIVPVILVGGGEVIVSKSITKICGLEVIRIKHANVANAVGAAIAQIGLETAHIVKITEKDYDKEIGEIIEDCKLSLILKGAKSETVSVLHINKLPLPYFPGGVTRITVKCIGDIDINRFTFKNDNNFSLTEYGKEELCNHTFFSPSQNPSLEMDDKYWIVSENDIDCISSGAGILGCGGGGNPWIGEKILKNTILKYKMYPKILLSNISNFFNEEDYILPVGMVGSPTVSVEKILSLKEFNININEIKNKSGDLLKISGLMSCEIGGMNSIIPLIASIIFNLPVVNFDGMGRAFPELQMYLPHIKKHDYLPLILVDEFGQSDIIQSGCLNTNEAEKVVRKKCIEKGCSIIIFMPPIRAFDLKKYTVSNSYTKSYNIGKEIRRKDNKEKYKDLMRNIDGVDFGTWKIFDVKRVTEDGFAKGFVTFQNDDLNDNQFMKGKIDFQNEYLILYIDDKVMASVPDLICIVSFDYIEPIMTEELRYGLQIRIFVLRAPPEFTTEDSLAVVSPKCFGFPNIDYNGK